MRKSGQFFACSRAQKDTALEKVPSEVSEEIGVDVHAPSDLFRSSPGEKSGQFLVRTHVRKNAQIPRISGGMSGALKLVWIWNAGLNEIRRPTL
jgi:hypothetical protein